MIWCVMEGIVYEFGVEEYESMGWNGLEFVMREIDKDESP